MNLQPDSSHTLGQRTFFAWLRLMLAFNLLVLHLVLCFMPTEKVPRMISLFPKLTSLDLCGRVGFKGPWHVDPLDEADACGGPVVQTLCRTVGHSDNKTRPMRSSAGWWVLAVCASSLRTCPPQKGKK